MQIEIWITLLVGMVSVIVSVVATALITFRGTRKTIEGTSERVSEIMSKHIGEAIKAIHEDIKHSQEKLMRKKPQRS